LDLFIEGREIDYSITDISEGAEIGRTTLFRIFDDLLKTKNYDTNKTNMKRQIIQTEFRKFLY